MTIRSSAINSEVLIWARERAGLTVEDVAACFKKDPTEIEDWESGRRYPTFAQLEKLSRTHYKVPLAVFFFPSPPVVEDPASSFRLLPEVEIEKFIPDTRFVMRKVRALQLSLYEMNEGKNPAEDPIFRSHVASPSVSMRAFSQKARERLGVSLEEQMSWIDAEHGFKEWREAIESAGILVFKSPFKQRDVSGFCLWDEEFPVICVSNSTTHTRQIFTLFHELAHLLFGISGLTQRDDSYITDLDPEDQKIETACNRFAGELLVPTSDFRKRTSMLSFNEAAIADLADQYNVSREVIARKLFNSEKISRSRYERIRENLLKDYLRNYDEKGGGNYYWNIHTYLGPTYIKAAFARYNREKCSLEDLVAYLGVKARNLSKLENTIG